MASSVQASAYAVRRQDANLRAQRTADCASCPCRGVIAAQLGRSSLLSGDVELTTADLDDALAEGSLGLSAKQVTSQDFDLAQGAAKPWLELGAGSMLRLVYSDSGRAGMTYQQSITCRLRN